jgi:hypothetical protein
VEVVTRDRNKIVDQDLYNQAQEVRDAAELVADVVTALHGEEGVTRGNPISKNPVIRFSEEPQGERLLKDLSAPPSDAQASRDVDRPTIRPPEYEGVPRDGDLEFPDFLGRMSEQRIADAFPDGEWCFLAADRFPAEVRNQLFNWEISKSRGISFSKCLTYFLRHARDALAREFPRFEDARLNIDSLNGPDLLRPSVGPQGLSP